MEFLGLHIPHVVSAVVVLYWMTVAVCLLSCVMTGWLWGKWKWCFLMWLISQALCILLFYTCLDQFTPSVWYTLIISPLVAFCFDKWRKWRLAKVEYFLISIFSAPFLLCLYLIIFLIAMSMGH